jgi:oligoribonuclease (3'-5' exoribonuclease)
MLADLQAAATFVNKQKLSPINDRNSHESNSHTSTNRTDSQDNLPHVTQAKRRATHNAVERRRRDRINQHIQQLAKLIPDCSNYVKNQVKFFFCFISKQIFYFFYRVKQRY